MDENGRIDYKERQRHIEKEREGRELSSDARRSLDFSSGFANILQALDEC